MNATVIVNPISGTGGRPDVVRARVEEAHALLAAHRTAGTVVTTERRGHARELAAAAVAGGATTVIAWGGDGTVNEVAGALAFGDIPLGIVPSGSGNGLARELGIPPQPDAAFAIALGTATRCIDCGEFDSRLFFNVAGVGLDARVAQEFAVRGLVRRGFRRYVEITTRELFRPIVEEHTIVADGATMLHDRFIVLAVANGRQYGNGALIAPAARLDDGLLDIVAVRARNPLVAAVEAPLLLRGVPMPGVTRMTAAHIVITSREPVIYHVDGEPFVGGLSVSARVRPGAVRVRVAG